MLIIVVVGFAVCILVLLLVFHDAHSYEYFRKRDEFEINKITSQFRCLDRCKNNYVFWLNSDQYTDYRDCINDCFPNPGIKMNILEHNKKNEINN